MSRRYRYLLLLPLLALSACKSALLNPSGDIAVQQRNLLIHSTLLMLLIIVPVMALTVLFAWRYRQGNKEAHYEPEWDHSTQLELVIWAAPLLIVICLGALTWLGTHLLDPYRQVNRLAPGKDVDIATQPLQVDIVALDWKWLFIYPQYDVATVNELALPIDRPVSLHITASSVMNSLYIPAFAGQVYAMPGMETQLHGVLNRTGDSEGFSANYSGAGFSGMHFITHGLTAEKFAEWIASVHTSSDSLTRDAYLQLVIPSERTPVHHYAAVAPGLYQAILNLCAEPGKMCLSDMMAMDARSDSSQDVNDVAVTASGKTEPNKICTRNGLVTQSDDSKAPDNAPLVGAGLTPPSVKREQSTLQSSLL